MLAAYDPDEDVFQSVCKAGTGFTEEDLEQHYKSLKATINEGRPVEYDVSDKMDCDVWFAPSQVIFKVNQSALTLQELEKSCRAMDHVGMGVYSR